jgi:hypothetical protein
MVLSHVPYLILFQEMLQDRPAARGVTAGGAIAAHIGNREYGAQRIDSVHGAPFHAREILL